MKLLDLILRGRGETADVVVIGSGLPALAVAWQLARRRRRVTVLGLAGAGERPAGLGLVALGPGRPYERVVHAVGHDDARVLWTAGRENLGLLRAFLEEIRRDCGLEVRGSFLMAADREEAESLAESEDMLRDDGFSGEFLDHYMLETRFDVSGFAAAYWAAEGAELDIVSLAQALAEAGRAAGVAFVPVPVRALEADRSAVTVETEEGVVRAGAAVVATDTVASGLAPALGPLLRPAASARLRIAPAEGAALPTAARTADGGAAWLVSSALGLTLAATGLAADREEARLDQLAARLSARPGDEHRWTEAAEVTADGLPVVGSLPGRSLAVACGFGPLAAGLAFVGARWIADALVTGRDPTPGLLRPRPATPKGPV